MMLSSQSSCSILLALSFLFSRAQGARRGEKEVIAYRTVSDEEAKYINKQGKPYVDNIDFMPAQLGTGFYTSNKPTQWRASRDEWYCVIEADSKKLKKISKVWIDQTVPDREEPLWYGDDDDLLEYIESVVSKDPEKALRFSRVAKLEEELQMNIPIEVVNNNELDLRAQCWKTKEELKEYKEVNWMGWDITGAPETEPEPEPES